VLETKINILILFYEKVFVFPFHIFNLLALWALPPIFPYGNTPQCYGTGQGERVMP
jgi:hypothetical protein